MVRAPALHRLGSTNEHVPSSTTSEQPPVVYPGLDSNYNFYFMNIAHLLRDSYKDKSKIHFLHELSNQFTLFVGLVETFLNDQILDSEITMEGFNLIRSDRLGRLGGGVCFYINNSVGYKVLLSYSNSICEVLIVQTYKPDAVLVNMYRPPNATSITFNDIVQKTESTIDSLESPLPNIIIVGDFNFPGIDWGAANQDHVNNISDLIELRDFLCLEQMITQPTRQNNVLDLLFCDSSIVNSIVIDKTVVSDHNIIRVNTNITTAKKGPNKTLNPAVSIFEQINFFKADWNGINSDIMTANLTEQLECLPIEESLNCFMKAIGNICAKNSPIKTPTHKQISKFFKQRKTLMRKRTKLRKSLNRNHDGGKYNKRSTK